MDFGQPPGDEIDPQAAVRPETPQPGYVQSAPQASYVQPVMVPVPGAVAGEDVVLIPAGFWPRFSAFLIDKFVLWILINIFLLLAGVHQPEFKQAMAAFQQFLRTFDDSALEGLGPPPWVGLLSYVIYGTYYTLFHAFNGATVGKMALGLQVRRSDGSPLTFGLALGRYLCYWFTTWLAYTAWFIPFDREKRTAYDALLKLNVFKVVAKQ